MKGRETEMSKEEDLLTFRPDGQQEVSLTQLLELNRKKQAARLELIEKIYPSYQPPDIDLLGR